MPERQGSDRAEHKDVEARQRRDESSGNVYSNRENRRVDVDKRGRTDATRGRGGGEASAPRDVQGFVTKVDYPAGKHEIIHHARTQGAPSNVLALLGRIQNRRYRGPAELDRALHDVQD